ncbi:hypothetical protein HKCCE3408_03265 [Rhodobacterales bacterium HKCCE3408]|nr:hypothetical protein [Rhodobacterales bacterium HKCCE3408]
MPTTTYSPTAHRSRFALGSLALRLLREARERRAIRRDAAHLERLPDYLLRDIGTDRIEAATRVARTVGRPRP